MRWKVAPLVVAQLLCLASAVAAEAPVQERARTIRAADSARSCSAARRGTSGRSASRWERPGPCRHRADDPWRDAHRAHSAVIGAPAVGTVDAAGRLG